MGHDMKPFTALDTCNDCGEDFIYYNGNPNKKCYDCKKEYNIMKNKGYIINEVCTKDDVMYVKLKVKVGK